MLKEYGEGISRTHRLIDVMIIIAAWYFSYLIRFNFLPAAQAGLFGEFAYIGLIISIVSIYVYEKFDLYKSFRLKSVFYELALVSKANFVVFTILIFTLYFIKDEKVSRIHLLIFLFISQFLLLTTRLIKANWLRSLRSKGRNIRYICKIGDGIQLQNFQKQVDKLKGSGLEIVSDANKDKADAFVVGYKNESQVQLNKFLKEHYNDVREIHILPEISYSLLGHKIEDFDGLPIITVNKPTFSVFELILKRIIDFLASTIGILIVSPILIPVAVLIKLTSRGPVFYGQERVGLDGARFKMWKFRSMKLAANNEDKSVWTSKGDPRITRIGAFIRRTSIDELPQLFNILLGDMSLVGPRPERTEFVEKFKNEIPNYMLRHKMKAGLTGWAQVNGWRGDTDLVSRIECDIYYIKNWSIWLDLKIIVMTFIKGFVNKNAY